MTKGYLPRKLAWKILLKVNRGIYSDHALNMVLRNFNLTPLDIAFITELSYGCIRYKKFLDVWIDHVSKLPHQKQPPKLRSLLHIGLYQLLKMDKIPHSASISTTVEIAKRTDLKGLAGAVNAILRKASLKIETKKIPDLPGDQIEKISYLNSLPTWLVKDMVNWLGYDHAVNIAKSFNKKPSIDLRINSLKGDMNLLLEELKKDNIIAIPIKELINGIELKSKPRTIKNIPGYKEGKWVIQDRSSQWIAPLLNPKKGDKILDACAAPGIKTTHIAELTNDQSEIWAIDRSKKRLEILKENLNRLDIKSVKTFQADSTKLISYKPEFLNYFDKILIDAPCSGIGTFSRNPDARWSLDKDKIDQLIILQEELLESNLPLLKFKGRLVYSTCTICPRENSLLIKKFLDKNRNLYLISEKQILPSFENPGDGFYAAIITHKS